MKRKQTRRRTRRSLLKRVRWARLGALMASVAAVLVVLNVQQRKELARWEASLAPREAAVGQSEIDVVRRLVLIAEGQTDLADREAAVAWRESAVLKAETQLVARDRELVAREQAHEVLGTCRDPELGSWENLSADHQFDLGRRAYGRGEFKAAERHFRNVLRTDPSHEQSTRYRDEAGYHYWVEVLARGGELSKTAKEILRRAEKRTIRHY